MWIRNEDRNGQKVLDEVEIGGTIWVEIADEKAVQPVCINEKNNDCAGYCLNRLS